MTSRKPSGSRSRGLLRPAQQGVALYQYALITGTMATALAVPIGNPPQSAIDRLTNAVQQEQSGFLYVAGLPSLPRGDALANGLQTEGGGLGGGGDGGATGAGEGDPGYDSGVGDEGGTGGAGGDSAGGSGSGSDPGSSSGDGTGGGESSAGDNGGGGDEGGGGEEGDASDGDGSGMGDGDDNDVADGGEGSDHGGPQYCANGDGGPSAPTIPGAGITGAASPVPGALQTAALPATHVGNPIHVLTGNKYQRESDITLPGLGLAFERHYNSRSNFSGVLGKGWRHSFETTLVDDGDRITLWQGDGRRINFIPTQESDQVRHYQARLRADGQLVAGPWGYEWRWHDGTLLTFSSSGDLESQRFADGRQLSLIRDRQGRLVRIQNVEGQGVALEYDRHDRLQAVTDSSGHVTHYRHDGHGRLIAVLSHDKPRRRYAYDDPYDAYNLTSIHVSHGSRERRVGSWRYDRQDRAIRSVPADALRQVDLRFVEGGTEVTDVSGRTSTYRAGRSAGVPVVAAIDGPGCSPCSAGGNLRYAYNARGQVTQITRANAAARVYAYDSLGRLTQVLKQWEGDQQQVLARLTYVGDRQAIATASIPSIKPGAERTITVVYDAQQQPVAFNETGFSPRPEGGFTAISRTRGVDADTTVAASGGQRVQPSVDDTPVSLAHDVAGAVSAIRYADGGVLRILGRNTDGRVSGIQLDDQPPLALQYDPTGHLSGVSSEQGRIRFRSTTALGSAMGNVDGAPAHLIALADGNGHVTGYGLDDFGRKAFQRSPDSGLTRFEYDRMGNLQRKIAADGSAVQFAYDAAGRMASATFAEGAAHFQWDAGSGVSRLVEVRTQQGRERYHRDADGRVTRRVDEIGEVRFSTRYRYGSRGRLVARQLPDQRWITYRYDDDDSQPGRLSGLYQARPLRRDRPLITGLDVVPTGGRMAGWTAFNGITTAVARAGGQLRGLQVSGLHDFTYHYNAQGKLTGIDDGGRVLKRFRFNAHGWLDFALTPEALFGYRYDSNGNRTRHVINGRQLEYGYADTSNRLQGVAFRHTDWFPPLALEVGDAVRAGRRTRSKMRAVSHGLGGEVEQLGDLRFHRNANGQIQEVWRGHHRIARYAYNSRAQRTRKTRFDTQGRTLEERLFLYEGDHLLAEADADGTILAQYLYLGHHPVVMLLGDQTYAIHTNHLGAPIAATDEAQAVVWRARYDPFGRAVVNDDPDADGQRLSLPLRFPGQYEDPETGLHYNHHRYYDPDLGRYLSSDPLGLVAGPNPYTYANNDPINHIDPTGLILFAFDGTGNSDPPGEHSDITNVVRFRDSYRDSESVGSPHYYINGPGTDTPWEMEGQPFLDGMSGESMPYRVEYMAENFFDYIDRLHWRKEYGYEFDVDTVGFSRGAAAARNFVSLIHHFLASSEGEFLYDEFPLEIREPDRGRGHRYIDFTSGRAKRARELLASYCFVPNLRFLGLFDTVPHYSPGDATGDISGVSQFDDLRQIDLTIPWSVQSVAHAVAVNENRRDFHGVSIHHRYDPSLNTEHRMELGFIGAHSDIGGGYGEGDLSDVAFMWMVQRAERAGVNIDRGFISRDDQQWHVVTQPVLHDSVGVSPGYAPDNFAFRPGRNLKFLNDIDEVPQQEWLGFGMPYQATFAYYDHRFLVDEWCFSDCQEYAKIDGRWKRNDLGGERTMVGAVDGGRYSAFLRDAYGLEIEIKTPDRE